MFGSLGAPELVLVVVICLLLFGTKRLPELGKGLGDGIRNFKKGMSGEPDDADENEKKGTR
jgi:sec-independent protein translocase protein TatA